jgi:alkylated DNA repair dioxygenase AlkB
VPPSPHGCRLTPGFLTHHQRLLERLRDDLAWTQHMRSRHTYSMGVPYNYAGASYPVTPWHPAVQALGARVAAAVGFPATNCLLNFYPTGQHSVGWHADDTTILAQGTGVAIVSLGETRTLKLRCEVAAGFHYEALPLPGGSLLLMGAAMQARWRHAIRREDTDLPRISLSFRHIVRWPAAPPPVPPR